VSLEHTARGIDPDQALAWWTDFRPGRHDHDFVPGARRRVRDAGPEGTVIEDAVRWLGLRVFSERVTAKQRGNKVQLVGENTFSTFRARYVFEHGFDPEGLVLRLSATIDLKGPLSYLEPVAKPIVERILAWDTDNHLEQMREALA